MEADIKMRANSTVHNLDTYSGCEFIVVANYEDSNSIYNYPLNEIDKSEHDIGVWRIKKQQ